MSRVVVDASVVVKWFVPEVHTVSAARWLDAGDALLVPDLVFPEVGNIVWKKLRHRELSTKEAREVLDAFAALALEPRATRPLLPAAFEIATALGRTVYDATYLALAVAEECALVTADRKLFDAVAASPLRRHARWVAERP